MPPSSVSLKITIQFFMLHIKRCSSDIVVPVGDLEKKEKSKLSHGTDF